MTTYELSTGSDRAGNAAAQATTILVVEDALDDFAWIRYCLQQAGFCRDEHESPLLWANSLAQGIAQARQLRPDVILLKTSLPDSSGISTVVAIRWTWVFLME